MTYKAQIPLCRLLSDVRDKSATTRDVPFSPNSIPENFPVRRSFGEVGVMEFGHIRNAGDFLSVRPALDFTVGVS